MTEFDGVDIDAIHYKMKAVLIVNIKNKSGVKPPSDASLNKLLVLAKSAGLNVEISVIDPNDDDGRC
jgi:hypothetical protein